MYHLSLYCLNCPQRLLRAAGRFIEANTKPMRGESITTAYTTQQTLYYYYYVHISTPRSKLILSCASNDLPNIPKVFCLNHKVPMHYTPVFCGR